MVDRLIAILLLLLAGWMLWVRAYPKVSLQECVDVCHPRKVDAWTSDGCFCLPTDTNAS